MRTPQELVQVYGTVTERGDNYLLRPGTDAAHNIGIDVLQNIVNDVAPLACGQRVPARRQLPRLG